jgi:hypothetical protein
MIKNTANIQGIQDGISQQATRSKQQQMATEIEAGNQLYNGQTKKQQSTT